MPDLQVQVLMLAVEFFMQILMLHNHTGKSNGVSLP